MSMKSFDKFCERIILAEPGSQKEIFDERQRQQRTQLTVEALLIYCTASALCVLLNEDFGFLESSFSGMVFIAAAAFLWWTIRALVKGCLFGVSGKQVIYNAVVALAETPLWIILIYPDDQPAQIIVNGTLSIFIVVTAGFSLYAVTNIIALAAYFRNKKLTAKS